MTWERTQGRTMGAIILVDDEGALLEALNLLIRREFGSFLLKSTPDPRQAKQWIEEERPTLLITDIRMPEISGLELLSCASQHWGTIPVILMTAYASPEVDALVRLGTFKYLPKPFHNHQLVSLVRGVLSPQRVGFDGVIAVSMLSDIIQLHALAGSHGILYIDSEMGSGSIWFSSGQIAHAITANAKAEEAFYEIIKWRGGRFSFASQRVNERTVRLSSSELLMEGYKRRDEEINLSTRPQETEARATSPPQSEVEEPVEIVFDLIEDEQETPQGEKPKEKEIMANNIKESLSRLEAIDGFLGACLADSESGLCLGTEGGNAGLNLEVAAASNSEVVKAKRKAVKNLNLRDDIEDILITLGKQYHLLRPVKTKNNIFFYLVLERTRANLALARMALVDIEKDLVI
jgi:DNA-binding response OmpR family regulator